MVGHSQITAVGNGINVCIAVYPGDSIDISFQLNTTTGSWLDEWAITPGSTGKGAGEVFSITDVIVPESRVGKFLLPIQHYSLFQPNFEFQTDGVVNM